MIGECPKNDIQGRTPPAPQGKCHGHIGNDGGVAHHGGVDQRLERTDL
jgi:hypothetical protein